MRNTVEKKEKLNRVGEIGSARSESTDCIIK